MSARVLVSGAQGRMGSFACALLERAGGFEVAARTVRGDNLGEVARECGAELGLDFTVAGLGFDHGLALLEAGLRPVIGTSGVSSEEVRELDRYARKRDLGGLVVANFSLGIACLRQAVRAAARTFAEGEIIELHHDTKRDAPSATARELRDLMGAEGMEEVAIHSVRLPGLYAHHEVLLGGPGETLSLRHDTLGPEAFGPGILAGLGYALVATGVDCGLEHALE
ncbi:MAG: hypothetical protein CMJ89_07565 [Planctomycetes bacterium]|nr:hypothetical protein [Planctomycetota bacterium]